MASSFFLIDNGQLICIKYLALAYEALSIEYNFKLQKYI